ncbi:unnamed protein product [Clonostachys solani]|uniref:Uncharacterized protein n=1 Tax=Clonostachys solani TaxID=160281 RepID=A0A9N9ZHJ6_9HYPO|nr:unnamed protein product [Clonostachys solani]
MWVHTTSLVTLATAILAVTQPALALPGTPGVNQAIRIDFFKSPTCGKANGSAYTYSIGSPQVGRTDGSKTAECFSLKMPGDSQSLKAVNPGKAQGGILGDYCYFYDDWGCKGKSVKQLVFGTGPNNVCQKARSENGWLWKSALCYVA